MNKYAESTRRNSFDTAVRLEMVIIFGLPRNDASVGTYTSVRLMLQAYSQQPLLKPSTPSIKLVFIHSELSASDTSENADPSTYD